MRQLAILVVDDSLIMRKKASAMLEGLGHQVVGVAATGAEAVEKVADLKPDLITMDITMPDMDGIEATRAILRDHELPIIMVTSHGQEAMVMEAVNAGAKGYVLKPIDKTKLGTVIDNVIERYL